MAKNIKSLSRATRQAKKAATNNTAKPLSLKSSKGAPARAEAERRAARDAVAVHRRPVLSAAKKAAGTTVKRERKAVYPEFLFTSMTPRQVKHLEKRPAQIEALRKEKAAKLLAAANTEKARVDALRDRKARTKAAEVRKDNKRKGL